MINVNHAISQHKSGSDTTTKALRGLFLSQEKTSSDWNFCLKIAGLTKQMFLNNLVGGPMFEDDKNGNSDFEIMFSLVALSKDDAGRADLILSAADSLLSDCVGDFLYSLDKEALAICSVAAHQTKSSLLGGF